MRTTVFLLILAIAVTVETCRHSGSKISAMEENEEAPETAKTVDQRRLGKKNNFYWYRKGKNHRLNFEKALVNASVPEASTKAQTSALVHYLRAPRSANRNSENTNPSAFFPKYCNKKLFSWCKFAPSISQI